MKSDLAKQVLQSIIDNTRIQLEQYATSNGMVIDPIDLSDQQIVRSVINSSGINDPELEEEIILEIRSLLKI